MAEPGGRRWPSGRAAIWLIPGVSAALICAFLAGYLLAGQAAVSPGASVSMHPGESVPTIDAGPAADDLGLLREIRDLVESEYLRASTVDRQKLLYGAARGMVQALDDPNSVYEPPAERAVGDSRWTGRYEGVGIYVDQRDGLLVVTSPIEGGPAERAGIKPGDIIQEADGKPLTGLSLTDQTLLIRGPSGTPVVLTIRREGQSAPLAITVVREEIRLISARSRMLDSGLGLIRITQFTEGTAEEARAALESLLGARPTGLILDLRSNGGGLLEPAVQATGLFLGGGTVVQEIHADGRNRIYAAPDGPPLTSLPMIVLLDRGSASASEVMAAALHDRGRAELVGERTYGKNTVQYIHRLSDGSGLRITVAQWHTPSGQLLPATGLTPDFQVATPAQPSTDRDPVLEAASQRLLSVVAGRPTPRAP